MRLKKSMSMLIAISMLVSNVPIVMAKEESVKIPSRSIYTHKEIIGKDRYETGRKVLEESKRFKNIIVVNGSEEKLVDGLCASGLVEKLNATILPINPKKVDKKSMEYINKAENVYIIGEKQAIPYSFEKSINKKVKVVRIGGKDRYETSEKIAKYIGSYDKAYLVNGAIGHPDAMSISSVAAKEKSPIILTKKDSSKADKKNGVEYTAIGGTSVISNSLVSKYSAKRIGGETRYETNRMVLNEYYPNSSIRYFTNGETLVDALSAASISKNNGITFINRHKNHDLLEYIDTVQVGGFPYDVVFVNNGTGTGGSGGTVVPPSKPNQKPSQPKAAYIVKGFDEKTKKYTVEISITEDSIDPDGDKVKYRYEEVLPGGKTEERNKEDKYLPGEHIIKVIAYDGRGGESKPAYVKFNANQAPSRPEAIYIVKGFDETRKEYTVEIAIKDESKDLDGDTVEYRHEEVLPGGKTEERNKEDKYLPGEHIIKVIAYDGRGGESKPAYVKFNANQAPSKPEISVTPTDAKDFEEDKYIYDRYGDKVIKYPIKLGIKTPSTDKDGDKITYEYKEVLGDGTEVTVSENMYYPVGEHTVKVIAYDTHGGKAESDIVTFTIPEPKKNPTNQKLEKPTVSYDFDGEFNNGVQTVKINAKINDKNININDNITYVFEYMNSKREIEGNEKREAEYIAKYPAGKHRVKVIAKNNTKGIESEAAYVEFEVGGYKPPVEPPKPNVAPTVPDVEIIKKEYIKEENSYLVTIKSSSTDQDGDKITHMFKRIPSSDNNIIEIEENEDGYVEYKAKYPIGKNILRVKAKDSRGEESEWTDVHFNLEKPEAILLNGKEFNEKIKKLIESRNVIKIAFVKEEDKEIPTDAIIDSIVLDKNEVVKVYIKDNELRISSDSVIYANEDCSSMFAGIKNITEIDFSNFDTSKVTDMESMFAGCSLPILDLSNFNTSSVTNMQQMFAYCSSLSRLELRSFDTSKVTTMESMFAECTKLPSLDLSNFNTSKVTTMLSMFYGCGSITSLDLSNFNTSSVETMQQMFAYCSSLSRLELRSFDTLKVGDMSYMFRGCSSLSSLNLSSFNTSNVTTMAYMFEKCSSLSSLDLSNFDTSNVTTMQSMFTSCIALRELTLSENFRTGNVTNMSNMFNQCSKLLNLDVSNFDTSKVTDMSSMFYYCESLTSLDVSEFNTSQVTTMMGMFRGCSALTSLDLDRFDTSKVTNMGNMFYGCSSLTSLNLSSFDTSNVTGKIDYIGNKNVASGMKGMFMACSSLTSLDLSSFDTSSVLDMNGMFDNCESLTNLDVNNFDTSQVRDMSAMFNNCKNLTSALTIKSTMLKYHTGMFNRCSTEPGSKFTLKYTPETKTLVETIKESYKNNPNIVIGEEVK